MGIIFVVAYPKSGSTWLTNLLGDILDSSTYGSRVGDDDIVTRERPGPYNIHRGHFVPTYEDNGLLVPAEHQLNVSPITDEKVIFLIRDPRDICVSGAYHWQMTPAEFLERMIRGNVGGCGRWDEYVSEWVHYNYDIINFVFYEELLEYTYLEIKSLLKYIGYHSLFVLAAEMRRHNMRRDIAGDWRNHFTVEMNDRIWREFGWMMRILDYGEDFETI